MEEWEWRLRVREVEAGMQALRQVHVFDRVSREGCYSADGLGTLLSRDRAGCLGDNMKNRGTSETEAHVPSSFKYFLKQKKLPKKSHTANVKFTVAVLTIRAQGKSSVM